MFTKELVGTANATVAGWGNLGGGVTQLLIGSLLFPLFKNIYNGDANKAWRTVCIFPAFAGLVTSVCVIKYTDDSPKGNYSKFKKQKIMESVSASRSFTSGFSEMNTWLMFIQYACCFGVEISMNNAAALYFKDEFELTTEKAAAIASIFGWMNLFARGLGGYISDRASARIGEKSHLKERCRDFHYYHVIERSLKELSLLSYAPFICQRNERTPSLAIDLPHLRRIDGCSICILQQTVFIHRNFGFFFSFCPGM